jgi:hypothetical protein
MQNNIYNRTKTNFRKILITQKDKKKWGWEKTLIIGIKILIELKIALIKGKKYKKIRVKLKK